MSRALVIVAIGIVLAGCSQHGVHPVARGETPTSSEWCMPISQAAVVAKVRRISDEVPASARVRAKLFGTDYWAVEVEGSPNNPPRLRDAPVAWVVYNIDAHTGDLRGASAGPRGSAPADWNALPDRTSSC